MRYSMAMFIVLVISSIFVSGCLDEGCEGCEGCDCEELGCDGDEDNETSEATDAAEPDTTLPDDLPQL